MGHLVSIAICAYNSMLGTIQIANDIFNFNIGDGSKDAGGAVNNWTMDSVYSCNMFVVCASTIIQQQQDVVKAIELTAAHRHIRTFRLNESMNVEPSIQRTMSLSSSSPNRRKQKRNQFVWHCYWTIELEHLVSGNAFRVSPLFLRFSFSRCTKFHLWPYCFRVICLKGHVKLPDIC